MLDNSHGGNYVTETNFRDEIWDDPATHMWDFHPSLGTCLWLRNSTRTGSSALSSRSRQRRCFLDEKSTTTCLEATLSSEQQRSFDMATEQGRRAGDLVALGTPGSPMPGVLPRRPVAQRIRPSRGKRHGRPGQLRKLRE